MSDQPATISLNARWVFPVSGPPLANGSVVIRGERIVAVEASSADDPIHDVAIVPGFVNAHTHLEFSTLASPLGQPGVKLPDWIRLVMASRRATDGPAWSRVATGLRQSLAAGTTALGEIATSDWRRPAALAAEPLPEVTMFHEAIAPTRARVEAAVWAAAAFLASTASVPGIRPALSPHAPYTVHPELLDALVELGRRYDVPLAMHLAESREELELLETGGGPMRDMLEQAGAWESGAGARHGCPRDYLERLAQAPRVLVVHGNYLAQPDIELLAEHAATMSVVYCPRTHHFFGHRPYPLAHMLRLGVPVALGTDSRASNPDLSLLAEMQFVAEHHWQLGGAKILELGTLAGARALGLDRELGTIEPGKLAHLAIVRLAKTASRDPYEALFGPGAGVVQTFIGGRPVHASDTDSP